MGPKNDLYRDLGMFNIYLSKIVMNEIFLLLVFAGTFNLCLGKHFRNHFRRIHVQGDLKNLLIVWRGVLLPLVFQEPLPENPCKVKAKKAANCVAWRIQETNL